MAPLSLGFDDTSSGNRLDEILARTQQAGAIAISALQQQGIQQQLASPVESTKKAGLGEALQKGLGTSGSEATGGSLEELLAGIQGELSNNEAELLGNGTPLGQALLGGITNLLSEGVAQIPGLEGSSGFGSRLFGKKKDQRLLQKRASDTRGLIIERDQRKFDNNLALRREKRLEESAKLQRTDLFNIEKSRAERDKKAADLKFTRDQEIAEARGETAIEKREDEQAHARDTQASKQAHDKSLADTKSKGKAEEKTGKEADLFSAVVPNALADTISEVASEEVAGSEFFLGHSGQPGIIDSFANGNAFDSGGQPIEKFQTEMKTNMIKVYRTQLENGETREQINNTFKDAGKIVFDKFRSSINSQTLNEDGTIKNQELSSAGGKAIDRLATVQRISNNLIDQVEVEADAMHRREKGLRQVAAISEQINPGNIAASGLTAALSKEFSSVAEQSAAVESSLKRLLDSDPRLLEVLSSGTQLQTFRDEGGPSGFLNFFTGNRGSREDESSLLGRGLLTKTSSIQRGVETMKGGIEESQIGELFTPELIQLLKNGLR